MMPTRRNLLKSFLLVAAATASLGTVSTQAVAATGLPAWAHTAMAAEEALTARSVTLGCSIALTGGTFVYSCSNLDNRYIQFDTYAGVPQGINQ